MKTTNKYEMQFYQYYILIEGRIHPISGVGSWRLEKYVGMAGKDFGVSYLVSKRKGLDYAGRHWKVRNYRHGVEIVEENGSMLRKISVIDTIKRIIQKRE